MARDNPDALRAAHKTLLAVLCGLAVLAVLSAAAQLSGLLHGVVRATLKPYETGPRHTHPARQRLAGLSSGFIFADV